MIDTIRKSLSLSSQILLAGNHLAPINFDMSDQEDASAHRSITN